MAFKYSASYHNYQKVLDFLITTKNGGTRWKIVQNTLNLDYNHAARILSQLTNSENLIYHKDTKRYSVSDKGRKLLRVIKKFNADYDKVIGYK